MKYLYALLLLGVFQVLNAQERYNPCAEGNNPNLLELQASNAMCSDNGTLNVAADDYLEFEFSITIDGQPLAFDEVEGARYEIRTISSNEELMRGLTLAASQTVRIVGQGCPSTNDLFIRILIPSTSNAVLCDLPLPNMPTEPTVAAPMTPTNIPTLGEWGLIIMGLLMGIIAVVTIRQDELNTSPVR